MRQVIIDTETTGRAWQQGDRIVEIAAIEMIDRKLTGREWRSLVYPERPIPEEVVRIHGITDAMVKQAPRFREVVGEFMAFIKDAEVLGHNVDFDVGMINNELTITGATYRLWDVAGKITDTLALSRSISPKERKHSLDALLDRYDIDRTARDKHGALLDCQLLAQVYLAMTEGLDLSGGVRDDKVRDPIVRLDRARMGTLATVAPVLESVRAAYVQRQAEETGIIPLEARVVTPLESGVLLAQGTGRPRF